MGAAQKGVTVQFSEKALNFIRTRRLKNPMVLINVAFRPGGESSADGCGGGCGGGCGEGEPNTYVPHTNTVLVDGGIPGESFAKVDTQTEIPVYMSKAALERAAQSNGPICITLKGLVMKKLVLEGLDLTSSTEQDSQGGPSCH